MQKLQKGWAALPAGGRLRIAKVATMTDRHLFEAVCVLTT